MIHLIVSSGKNNRRTGTLRNIVDEKYVEKDICPLCQQRHTRVIRNKTETQLYTNNKIRIYVV